MKIKFSILRWFSLIVSFIFLTFGVHILGTRLLNVYIPTFACPFTYQGAIEASCYYLIHPKTFFMLPAVLIGVFASLVVFSIVFGRLLCGFVCPFGFIQDVLYKIRQLLNIKPIRFTDKQYKWIAFIKWIMLAIFLGGYYIGLNFCYACPVMLTTPLFTGTVLPIYMSGFVAIFIFAAVFFKNRFWCNICPFGLLIGLFYKISFFRLKKDCQACTECGACYEACPMGIKEIYTERGKSDITTHNCLLCGECVKCCPENNGLALSFFNKKFYVARRKDFFNEQGIKKDMTATKKIKKLVG